MSNPYAPLRPGAKPSGKWAIPAPPPSQHHHGGGVTGFVSHLAGDIKNTVYGLPTGAIELVRHPIRGTEMMGHQMWQTWSPLFHGHVGQFAHNFYDHPLAPILDVMTVATLGAAAASSGASLLDTLGVASAREGTALGKLAALHKVRTETIPDKLEGGTPKDYNFSKRPGRRIVQEVNWKLMTKLEEHLPKLTEGSKARSVAESINNNLYGKQARYKRLQRVDIIHKAMAKNLWINMALQAGKALTDPATAPHALREIVINQYMNFVKHAREHPIHPDDATVLRYRKDGSVAGTKSSHFTFVRDLRSRTKLGVAEQEAMMAKHEAEMAKYQDQVDAGKVLSKQLSTARAKRTNMLKEGKPQEEINPVNREIANLQRQRYTLERQSERLRQVQKKFKKAQAKRDKLLEASNKQTKELFDITPRKGEDIHGAFQRRVKQYNWALTDKPEEALRDTKGNYLVVPHHDAKLLGHEAGESVNFLRWFWRKPSSAWKVAQVGYSPRTVTQNAIGNYTIYALRSAGHGGLAGLYHAVKFLKGDRAAAKIAAVSGKAHEQAWIYKHFADELGDSLGHEVDALQGGITKTAKRRLKSGFYPVVHRLADEPVRLAGILTYLKSDPAVEALMKKGYSFQRASRVAMKQDRSLRGRAAEYTRTISGDYSTKGPIGKVLSDVVPFYLWDKHILKSTGNLVADTPGRAALATRVGEQGVQETEKLLGLLPEFLTSAVPAELLPGGHKPRGGRADIFQTAYLNPFATIGDLASAGEGLATGGGVNPGAAIAGNLNPFLTGGAESLFGRSLLTGQQIPRKEGLLHGLFAQVGGHIAAGIPAVRIAEQLHTPSYTTSPKTGKELLYSHDKRSLLTAALGLPVRNISQTRAKELYDEEQKTLQKLAGTYQKPPRKSRFYIPPL